MPDEFRSNRNLRRKKLVWELLRRDLSFSMRGTREVFMNACGSLNGLDPHILIESDINRRYGVGVTLLEEVCHSGGGL